jgi:hypothetical protein
MITAAGLALWLRVDTDERAGALADLVETGDLHIVGDDDLFGLIRGHDNVVTYFEVGAASIMPVALA